MIPEGTHMRIVDLSLPIDNNMRGVRITRAKSLETDGWNASTLELYSHCGTHMDAPIHFVPEAATIEQQDLAVCVGPAWVLNLAPAQPRQLITVEHVAPLHSRLTPGCRILFRTDWYRCYGTDAYRDELPRISLELAHWLVDKRVGMIGVEQASVADVNNRQELTEVHRTLFEGGVLIVEGLANLDQLTQPEVEFIALPLNLPGIDGSPVRAIAIERTSSGPS